MEDQTQEQPVTETTPEAQTSNTIPVSQDGQTTSDQPTTQETPATPDQSVTPAEASVQTDTTTSDTIQTQAQVNDGSLHKYGLVEIELADGTRQQMTVQQAQDELTKYENIKKALEVEGGTQNAA